MAGAEQIWTIVVGGGSGRRFGAPKQYEPLGDRRVIDWARAAAGEVSDGVVVVVPAADAAREHGVAGGATRSASVRAGLAAVPDDATIVCVHDAARPFAGPDLFRRLIDEVAAGADAAIPGIAVVDTIKLVDDGVVTGTVARDRIVAVQTPQVFRADVLRRAHRTGGDDTDDAALVEALGATVRVVAGDPDNRKLTHPDDLRWARERVEARIAG